MSQEVIYFYRTQDKYGCFSNFASYPIELKKKIWPTSEHYFQAQKYSGTDMEEKIRKAKSPGQAARMGRDRKNKLRRDWDNVRVSVMREAILAKFLQHPEIREILISTGTARLVEHTERDNFWADGGDGRGKNMLGKILMDLRDELGKNHDG